MKLLLGNNLGLLRTLPDNSVDAIVTDPPYGLGKEPDALAMLRDWVEYGHHDVKSKKGFMGKEWVSGSVHSGNSIVGNDSRRMLP